MNPQPESAWRHGLLGPVVALTVWLSAPMAVVAEPESGLPHPTPSEDPRWLDLLPPLTLPLEKPAERAAATVRPAVSDARVPDATPPAIAAPALAEPAPWLVETPQAPSATSMSSGVDDAVSMPETPEETEDAALIDVIETLPIAQTADNPEPPVEAEQADELTETSGYRWHVQLLAGRSLERVKEDQRLFVHRYGDLLQGLTLTISQSRYGDARDEFYRLRAIEWANRQAAFDWCNQLRTRGHQCLVTRILRGAD